LRVVSWAWEIAMHFVNFIYLTAAVYVGVYLLIPAVLFVAAADTWEMFRGGALNKETSWTYFLMTILYKVYIGMQYRINGYKPGWLMRFRAPAYTTGAVRHFVRIVKALIDESERLEKDVEKIYNDSDRKSLIAAIHMVQVDLHEAMDYLREVGVSTQLGHKIQKIGNLLTRTQ